MGHPYLQNYLYLFIYYFIVFLARFWVRFPGGTLKCTLMLALPEKTVNQAFGKMHPNLICGQVLQGLSATTSCCV